MRNNLLIVFGVLAVALLTLFIVLNQDQKVRYKWHESYDPESKQPYGAYLLLELLKDRYGEDNYTEVSGTFYKAAKNLDTNSTYDLLFIGDYLNLSQTSADSLMTFVDRGNDAFFIGVLPYEVLTNLSDTNLFYEYAHELYHSFEADTVEMSLTHSGFRTSISKRGFMESTHKKTWYYMDTLTVDSSGANQGLESLGYLDNEFLNFARIKHGDGYFYFHLSPICFSNYQINQKEELPYIGAVLNYMQHEQLIYMPSGLYDYYNEGNNFGPGPLSFILTQKPLRFAWYLLLALLLIYLLFRAKRLQRAVPVLQQNENTSLEFVKSVGRLYFLQNNNKRLCLEMFQLFLTHIRSRYQLSTTEEDEHFYKLLSLRSGIEQEKVQRVFKLHQYIKNEKEEVDNDLLTNFYLLLEEFYQK